MKPVLERQPTEEPVSEVIMYITSSAVMLASNVYCIVIVCSDRGMGASINRELNLRLDRMSNTKFFTLNFVIKFYHRNNFYYLFRLQRTMELNQELIKRAVLNLNIFEA